MIELENHDHRVRGEAPRPPQNSRPKPAKKPPTRLFHVIQCEGVRDWSFEIVGDVPSWDDHAVALEEMYSKMVTDS
eukprot:5876730-Amphidinium_carterae.1